MTELVAPPAGLAVLLGFLFIMFVIKIIGLVLPKEWIFDDIANLIIVVVGIGAIVSTFGFVQYAGPLVQYLISLPLLLLPGDTDPDIVNGLAVILNLFFVFLAIRWYWKGMNRKHREERATDKAMWFRLLIIAVLLIPFYSLDYVQVATNWMIENLGPWGWNGMVTAYNKLVNTRPS